ncbi:MAG: cation-translocating P-type ATPase [Candidatus Diapherotrites archaeon]|nr:cation-translocating P-type ATPase [Candidatus Diapherotrites archaeon]
MENNSGKAVPWHAFTAMETAKELGSDMQRGLTNAEAEKRLAEFGENRLAKAKKFNALKILANQFSSFLIWILLVAVAISFAIGEHIDGYVILAIVVMNAILGFRQEYRAEKAMAALEKLAVPKAIVIRNGREIQIDSSEVVPGDIIVLNEGDKVSGDARIIESVNLKTSEAALTGESMPVQKQTEKISEKAGAADRKNTVFMNTIIVFGRGKAIVTATGMQTEFGKISGLIQTIKKEKTPLAQNINTFAKKLAIAIVAICIVVFITGLLAGNPAILMFQTAVSLAVAVVPEGLPAVVTITLALGMAVMARNKAIVRKMSAVETLGSTSVICSDKTGTLTRNELTVKKVFCNNNLFTVTGTGFNAIGRILFNEASVALGNTPELKLLLETGALCNNAKLYENSSVGDPTEIALLALGKKGGIEKQELEKRTSFLQELPFDSNRKRMSVVFSKGMEKTVYSKGGVESIISQCKSILISGQEIMLDSNKAQQIIEQHDKLASQGYRVLGLAYKKVKGELPIAQVESQLTFLGMTAMIDAPRKEAIKAVELSQLAGIQVKMITGDHMLTAMAIAKQLGIIGEKGKAITGAELKEMSDSELERKVRGISVFARVNPEHKLRIVKALQKKGLVVAVTGDGINDAPALKKSDIGVAMGLTGTEVSKEASDMVVMDDNFATIVKAIEEGRRIFENIKNFVKYLLAANTAEVLLILLAITLQLVFGKTEWALPLLPAQLLFINLVTDGLPAIALGNERAQKEIMLNKPRKKNEGVLHKTVPFIIIAGLVGAVFSLLAFQIGLAHNPENVVTARTMAFATIILFETILAFNCRSERNVFQMNPLSNKGLVAATVISLVALIAIVTIPWLQYLLSTTSLSLEQWAIAIAFSLPALAIPLIEKPFRKIF